MFTLHDNTLATFDNETELIPNPSTTALPPSIYDGGAFVSIPGYALDSGNLSHGAKTLVFLGKSAFNSGK